MSKAQMSKIHIMMGNPLPRGFATHASLLSPVCRYCLDETSPNTIDFLSSKLCRGI